MTKILTVFLLSAFLYFPAQAQSGGQQPAKKEVAAAVQTLRKAMIDADEAALKKITADQLSYGHSSGKLEDKAAYIKALTSGQSDFETMDLSNETITIAGNTALVRHELTAKVRDNGKPNEVHLGILLVWQKQDGQWKLLARQAYKI